MAIFPKITRPCPARDRLGEVMDGDLCRLCNERVTDLTPMSEAQRRAFVRANRAGACVSYRLPAGLAAAAFAAAAFAAPMAMAREPAEVRAQQSPAGPNEPPPGDETLGEVVVVGGIGRSEPDLRQVPIAVTVVSSDDLERQVSNADLDPWPRTGARTWQGHKPSATAQKPDKKP